jgi:hypothetical protein
MLLEHAMRPLTPLLALGDAERRKAEVQRLIFLHFERDIAFAQSLIEQPAATAHIRFDQLVRARETYRAVQTALESHTLDPRQVGALRRALKRLQARIETVESLRSREGSRTRGGAPESAR